MAEESATPDLLVARIAARQHGVLSIHQLRKAGLSDDAVLGRVRAGRLHRIHRGVCAVGHSGLTHEGRCMGAALACGEGAAVSHRSAAALWGLLPPAVGPVEVAISTKAGRRRRAGIRRHRLPAPELNVRIGSMIVDFIWRDHWLVAETDGYRYHRGQAAFEDDHARDLELRALGYDIVRFTYRQVTADPKRVSAALRKAMARSSAIPRKRRHATP